MPAYRLNDGESPRPATLLMITAFISGPAIGDDLSGADRLLCSTLQATACRNDGECVSLLPEDLNIHSCHR
jgi:hypothetical protein